MNRIKTDRIGFEKINNVINKLILYSEYLDKIGANTKRENVIELIDELEITSLFFINEKSINRYNYENMNENLHNVSMFIDEKENHSELKKLCNDKLDIIMNFYIDNNILTKDEYLEINEFVELYLWNDDLSD